MSGSVLAPQLLGLRNQLRHLDRAGRGKLIITLIFIGLVWVGLYLGLRFFLLKLHSVELLGPYLVDRLLSVLLLSFSGLLMLSNIVSSLGVFYLAEDLPLVHALPVSSLRLYYTRFVYNLVASSWMVVVFGLPVLMAYASVNDAGPAYFPVVAVTGLGFVLIPASLGVVVTTILVNIFPARKARDVLIVLGALFLGAAWFLFRAMRPERLVDPAGFADVTAFLAALALPQQGLLPSTWASQAISAAIRGELGQAWSAALFVLLWGLSFTVLSAWFGLRFYRSGFSRAQEGRPRRLRVLGGKVLNFVGDKLMSGQRGALSAKDLRHLVRDPAQWGQLVLLVAMVAIYLFSVQALPFDAIKGNTDLYRNAVAFLNIGMTAFVQAAVAVRFAYPAVSMEGRGIWVLRSAPMSTKLVLQAKWRGASYPIVLFGVVLAILSNVLLQTDLAIMVVASIDAVALGLALCALATGIGAILPDFKVENPVKAAASFGGLVYMSGALVLIVMVLGLQSYPAWQLMRAQHLGGELNVRFALASLIGDGLPLLLLWLVGRKALQSGAQSLAQREL